MPTERRLMRVDELRRVREHALLDLHRLARPRWWQTWRAVDYAADRAAIMTRIAMVDSVLNGAGGGAAHTTGEAALPAKGDA